MRLFEDGFDHYGGTPTAMLDGVYAQAECALDAGIFATGSHSMHMNSNGGVTSPNGLRRVLPVAIDKIGLAGRFYFPSLPTVNYQPCIFGCNTTNNAYNQLLCGVDSNGGFVFIRGGPTYGQASLDGGISGIPAGVIVAQSNPAIVAAAWNHIEFQCYIHATLGWVRVAVNGVHVFEATGLNTQYDTTKIASVVQRRSYIVNAGSDFYLDDYYIYDFNGNSAIDTDFCPTVDGTGKATSYIGDLQVWPLFPNGDTAQADWQKSSGGVGYSLINEVPPNDATYVYANAAGNLSEFDLDDLPIQITYIRGLGLHQRLSKSDAGAAMSKVGMKSVAAVTDSPERPLTTHPTYWRDAIDIDPNSGGRWTRASLNAAKYRQTRSV